MISEYKEIELQRKSATPDVLAIIDYIQDVITETQEKATMKFPAEFMQPHVIDLSKNGHIGNRAIVPYILKNLQIQYIVHICA